MKTKLEDETKSEDREVEVSNVVRLLTRDGICVSQSEAKRLVAQGAVNIDGEVVTDPYQAIDKDKVHLKVGKKFEQDVEVKKE